MLRLSSTLPLVLMGATSVLAQTDPNLPLASKHFAFTALPYQVDPTNGPRGIQTGYNICNSTTEGPNSLCQTMTVNSLDDFCIWGPPKANSTIADTEGELVAWCTKPGRGTRVIPPGTFTGVQFMRTPDYLQVTGRLHQTGINIADGDSGGEEDPHGADGRGNPIGSVVYTNGFPSNHGNNNTFQQVIEWHNFLGGDMFCIKVCDPAGPRAAELCQHIYDRIGCLYNAPAAYTDGVFESCDGDDQDPPGVFTGSDGHVSTYSQPPESLGVISSMPYQPKIPASSNCVTFQSAQLFAAAGVFSNTSSAVAATSAPVASAVTAGAGSASRTGSPSSPSSTSTTKGNGALGAVGPHLAALLAVAVLAVAAA